MGQDRCIVHTDMDAFFASIEQRDRPRLKGMPVVVGADPRQGKGRGVVSTCSYEARRFGIRSAMPISRAYRLCPHACFLPVDMAKYRRESERIFAIFDRFSPLVEPVSIDEAYLDITETAGLFGGAHGTCVRMKAAIRDETGLTASVGLAPTKMAAKIASDLRKPDGLVEVTREGLGAFLRPLDIGVIWGLGPKARERLLAAGIRTVGELADRGRGELEALFGANGAYFWQAANGIDEREVENGGEAKSMSAESTFDRDTSRLQEVRAEISGLCERVSQRLRREKLVCRTVTVKLRFADFSTHTRACTRPEPTNFTEELIRDAVRLFDALYRRGEKVRLVGVKASGLTAPGAQMELFPDPAAGRKEKLHDAVETIREKFGHGSISRASSRER